MLFYEGAIYSEGGNMRLVNLSILLTLLAFPMLSQALSICFTNVPTGREFIVKGVYQGQPYYNRFPNAVRLAVTLPDLNPADYFNIFVPMGDGQLQQLNPMIYPRGKATAYTVINPVKNPQIAPINYRTCIVGGK